ncbi:11633_t:CDS:2 [Entrophospora sp. SA101]|nr:11633_t:CDS:2 [Entrophospora sp. SA101]CAJ0880604.1 8115_t:CDS:2 [Entrophospora sp. SA101]
MKNFTNIGKKIIGIGQLGNAVPANPFFFLKPTSSYVLQGQNIELPKGCIVHHEESEAFEYVDGYALGIDLTARNVQDVAKKNRLPWSVAKGFDTFTPIGDFIPKKEIKDPSNIDDEVKQNGDTKDMIFPIPKLIQFIRTPSGVGPIKSGQIVTAGLNTNNNKNISNIKFSVVDRDGLFEFKE